MILVQDKMAVTSLKFKYILIRNKSIMVVQDKIAVIW